MRPTLRAIVLFLAGIPVSPAAVVIAPRLWTAWVCYLAASVVLLGLDVVLGMSRRKLRLTTVVPEQLYIGHTGTAQLTLTSSRQGARVELLAELDADFVPQQPIHLEMRRADGEKRASGTAVVTLAPRRRGEHSLRAIHARWTGPFGLIEKRTALKVDKSVGVVPDLGTVRAVALRMFADQHYMQGMKVEKFIGDGSEFEALREYVPGLDHRALDWKSSARHRKLLVQEYRAERNHQVVIAIDNGQLMSEPLNGVPKLDHAINAALLLSWFCLRTGDRVGLAGFDERVRQWSEPAGGMHAFARLQAMSAELDYRHVETNYTLMLSDLSTRLRRRSLVVLFTDFLDTVTAQLMIDSVTRLARRHLVLFVSLRDPSLEKRALAAPRSLSNLHQAVVASDFVRERQVVLERLKRAGASCIDSTPEMFSMGVVNRYLDLKRRELF